MPLGAALLDSWGLVPAKIPDPKKAKKKKGSPVEVGDWEEGVWWRRRLLQSYLPPLSLEDQTVKDFLRAYALMD